MTVVLDFEPDLERGLQAQAEAQGVTIENFIRELVSQQVRVVVRPEPGKRTLSLPARDLGEMGPMHRRDIYDNAD